jgi:hypothetical protein
MPTQLRPTKVSHALMFVAELICFCRVRIVTRISACRGTGEFATPHFGASAATATSLGERRLVLDVNWLFTRNAANAVAGSIGAGVGVADKPYSHLPVEKGQIFSK